jgi:hypothetical protein
MEFEENSTTGKITIDGKLLGFVPISYSKEFNGRPVLYNGGKYVC